MQTIGTMNDGRRLAVLTTLEYDILELIDQRTEVRKLSQAPIPATEPVALQINARGGRTATAAGIPAAKSVRSVRNVRSTKCNRQKKCKICRNPFVDNTPQNKRIICKKPACKKALKKQYMIGWRLAHGKLVGCSRTKNEEQRTLPANPSDPFLTDEQRKEMRALRSPLSEEGMARREKLIAESARRHAEE